MSEATYQGKVNDKFEFPDPERLVLGPVGDVRGGCGCLISKANEVLLNAGCLDELSSYDKTHDFDGGCIADKDFLAILIEECNKLGRAFSFLSSFDRVDDDDEGHNHAIAYKALVAATKRYLGVAKINGY